MDPAQRPIAELLAKLPASSGAEALPQIETLAGFLAAELGSQSSDTSILFAGAFQSLRDLPAGVNSRPVVRALRLSLGTITSVRTRPLASSPRSSQWNGRGLSGNTFPCESPEVAGGHPS